MIGTSLSRPQVPLLITPSEGTIALQILTSDSVRRISVCPGSKIIEQFGIKKGNGFLFERRVPSH